MKKKITAICLVVALAAVAVIGGTLAYFTDTTDEVTNTFTMGKNIDISLDEAPVELVDGELKPVEGDDNRVTGNDYSEYPMTPGFVFPKDPTIHGAETSGEAYLFLDLTINKYSSLFWLMAADASADEDIDFTIFDEDEEGVKTLSDDFANESGVFSTTKFIAAMAGNKDVFQAMIDKWITGIEHEDWQLMVDPFKVDKDGNPADNGAYMTFRFGYIGSEGTDIAEKDIKFMDSFQIPGTVTQEMFDEAQSIGQMKNKFNTDSQDFFMNFVAYAIQASSFDSDTADTTVDLEDLQAAYDAMFPAEEPAEEA